MFSELDHLKEKTARSGNNQFAARLVAMLQVARQAPGTAASTPAALTVAPDPSSAASISSILTGPASANLENGPTPNGNGGVTTGGATVAFSTGSAGSAGSGAELRHRKSQSKGGKCKSPKNSPDSGDWCLHFFVLLKGGVSFSLRRQGHRSASSGACTIR